MQPRMRPRSASLRLSSFFENDQRGSFKRFRLTTGTSNQGVAPLSVIVPEFAAHELEMVNRPLHDVKGLCACDGLGTAPLHRARSKLLCRR